MVFILQFVLLHCGKKSFLQIKEKNKHECQKSKTFFKTLTAILVLLLFFGGYYIYSSGIFGASVTENISEHSITDEERLIEYEEYGRTMYMWYYNDLESNKRGDCLSYSVDVPE